MCDWLRFIFIIIINSNCDWLDVLLFYYFTYLFFLCRWASTYFRHINDCCVVFFAATGKQWTYKFHANDMCLESRLLSVIWQFLLLLLFNRPFDKNSSFNFFRLLLTQNFSRLKYAELKTSNSLKKSLQFFYFLCVLLN